LRVVLDGWGQVRGDSLTRFAHRRWRPPVPAAAPRRKPPRSGRRSPTPGCRAAPHSGRGGHPATAMPAVPRTPSPPTPPSTRVWSRWPPRLPGSAIAW